MALVAWYKLDGNLLDSSGNGFHSTDSNGTFVNGKINQSIQFDGTSYVSIPNVGHNSGHVTMSAWVKSKGMASGQTLAGIVSLSFGASIYINDKGNFGSRLDNGSSLTGHITSGLDLHDDLWHHVAMTYNGVHKVLYVDGQEIVRHLWSDYNSRYSNSGAIGADVNNTPRYKFWGQIDDVRIYDHALSEKEVKELAQAKVLHYKFDEDSGEVVYDCSGYENHGTISPSSAPVWVNESALGIGAYEFSNNVGSNILVPHTVKPQYQLTVSAWAYREDWSLGANERIVSNTHSGGYALAYKVSAHPNDMSFWVYVGGAYVTLTYPVSNLQPGYHFFTGTFDGETVKFYVDGVLVDSSTKVGYLTYHLTAGTFIGAEAGSSPTVPDVNTFWNGLIDDFRIYATALSEEDIKELYQQRASLDNKGNLFAHQFADPTAYFLSKGGDKWEFDDNLDSLRGVKPLDGAVATLRPNEGRFGGAVAVEEGTENLAYSPLNMSIGNFSASPSITLSNLLTDTPFGRREVLVIDGPYDVYIARAKIAQAVPDPNKPVTVSLWMRSISGEIDYPQIYAGKSYFYADNTYKENGQWTQITKTFQPGQYNPENVRLHFTKRVNGIVELCAVQIEQKPFATSFVDGSRGGGTLRYNSSLNDNFTLSFWMNLYEYSSTENRYIFDTDTHSIYLLMEPNNRLILRCVPSGGSFLNVVSIPYSGFNKYVNVTCLREGDKVSLYLDGELQGSRVIPNIRRHNGSTLIGEYYGSAILAPNGLYDELLILPYALSDEEVKLLYEGSKFNLTKSGVMLSNNFSEVGITEGLVAYYPLNGDADDYSGNSNHGTVYGAVPTAGIHGLAYSFDGVDDYISIPNAIGATSSFSLSFWGRTNIVANQCFGSVRRATGEGFSVFILVGNYLRFDTEKEYQWSTSYSMPTNEWVHITVTKDDDSKKLYVNGAFHSSTTQVSDLIYLSDNFLIGASGSNGVASDNYLNGDVCDYRIYNRALSPEEVQILYNTTKPNPSLMQVSSDNTLYVSGEFKEV